MSVTVHSITRHTVQVLTRKRGEEAHSFIIVRLYDADAVCRGVVLFENYDAGQEPPKPVGDHKTQMVTLHLDVAHYQAYLDILRHEKSVYLKIAWSQTGRTKIVTHASIDTKKEILGQYFAI